MQWKLPLCIFCIACPFWVTRGQKGLKSVILCRVGNFYFSSDFDGVSFIGFLSKKDEIGVLSDFSYLLPFPRKNSWRKIQFFKIFYFSSNFDAVYFKWFLVKNATKVVPKYFFVYLAVLKLQGAEMGWKVSFCA